MNIKKFLQVNTVEEKDKKYLKIPLPGSISLNHILVLLLVIGAFYIGSLTTKLKYLETASKTPPTQVAAAGNTVPQAIPTENLSPKQVSIDDDPVLGSKDAKVTIVEFSDYECPFCKRHFDQTFPDLKKEYIDTGKVKLVYRDLPLSFHDPMATTEAIAANCARNQGGDPTYFKYHDEIFKRTTSNGNGLTKDALYKISDGLGLNTTALKTCMDDPKQAEEVKKDLADATAVGATGTPAFFVGKSTANGVITGTKVNGAQPFSAFKTIIDQQLQ